MVVLGCVIDFSFQRRDIDKLEASLSRRIDDLRSEMVARIADLRSEMVAFAPLGERVARSRRFHQSVS